jgi:reverse gyrase
MRQNMYDVFISIQEYLKNELEEIENGTAEFVSIDQLDNELGTTIKKQEA